jgi:hypothetical protein
MAYSDNFPPHEGPLSPEVTTAITAIKSYFGMEDVRVLRFDDSYILILVTFHVAIPPNGTIGGIDIREHEPCMIKIPIAAFPNESPMVISDREDFPRRDLGHLYVSASEALPGAFCLVRNDAHEWFANTTIIGLLVTVEQWLFKAAIGRLNEDGDEFDPTRLDSYSGYHVYKYNTVLEIVTANHRLVPAHPFSVMMACGFTSDDQITYKSISNVAFIQLPKTIELINKINEDIKEEEVAKLLLSIVVWSDNDAPDPEYCTTLPRIYGELRAYFQSRGIDIDAILKAYSAAGLHLLNAIPIIHAIRRPKKMIGYNGNLEFINFLVNATTGNRGRFADDLIVKNQSHTEPFSKELATELSGDDRSVPTLYVGAGSLGSKLITHEIRCGNLQIGIADQDEIMQHNLVRHELFNESIGRNKAHALVRKAKNFFTLDKIDAFKAFPYRIHHIKEEDLHSYSRIVDSTASLAVQNWLTKKQFENPPVMMRAELVHQGKLGLAYIEGKDRNPRIDDLINLTYYRAIGNPVIARWRIYDSSAELMNLNVGLGCSSPTTVMSDDTISFHASIFSRLLQNYSVGQGNKNNGLLFRSILQSNDLPVISSQSEMIPPFEAYQCCEDSGWEIRFVNGCTQNFLTLCKKRGKVETGGILIGMCNYNTKTIHVFDIIKEPQDSKGTCVGFIRGTKGMPALVNQIKEKSGQMVGYIGEWHTHPMDLEGLSGTDRNTIKDLQVVNRRVPIPTLAIIVTTRKVMPFVFE